MRIAWPTPASSPGAYRLGDRVIVNKGALLAYVDRLIAGAEALVGEIASA